MEGTMEYIVYFILTFLIVYTISYFLMVRKAKEYNPNKIPIEVAYLLRKNKLDMKKISYHSFVRTISLVGALIMAITVVAIFPIQNILLQLLVGFLIMIPLIFISYQIIANYYKKKGSKDDEHKKNRK